MAYQQDANVKLKQQRSKQAVALAMQGRWREAAAANKLIIDAFPEDFEAYNRLGRSHMELREYTEARAAYQQALQIDPHNAIARKNLSRLSNLGDTEGSAGTPASAESGNHHAEPQIFIEEIGKGGVVTLDRIAPKEVLAKMVAGDIVNLKIEGNSLSVESTAGEYLGQVEPRHAGRLIRLAQGGNKYAAAVVSSAADKMAVIIKEVYQDPSQAGVLSFPPRGSKGARPYAGSRPARPEGDLEEEGAEEPAEAADMYEDPGSNLE